MWLGGLQTAHKAHIRGLRDMRLEKRQRDMLNKPIISGPQSSWQQGRGEGCLQIPVSAPMSSEELSYVRPSSRVSNGLKVTSPERRDLQGQGVYALVCLSDWSPVLHLQWGESGPLS